MTSKLDIFKDQIQKGVKLTEVDLSNCGLDQLPDELFQLADTLEFLNIGGNKLSSLPSNFSIFKKLRILFAPNNFFTELPSVLGKLSSLFMLSFKSNQISHIPEDSLSPSIGWLILTGNRIEALPASIGALTPLRKLMLAGNCLTNLPPELANCTNLELIRLACNRLTSLPPFLLQLPKLAWIALSGNPGLSVRITGNGASEDRHSQPLKEYSWNELVVGDKLGEGASGTVYKATWKSKESGEGICDGKQHEALAVKLFKGENTSDGSPEDEMKACVAAGSHESSIGVIGRLIDTPGNQLGLILEYVPASFTILGQPPSFTSVTRDCYAPNTQFDLPFVLHTASHIAHVSMHLHTRGINHGDLYAHNILVERNVSPMDGSNNVASTRRPPLLGDFGAASFYSEEILGGRENSLRFQKCEVRAFGCLLEELLDRLVATPSNTTSDTSSVVAASDEVVTEGSSKRPRKSSAEEVIRALHALEQDCLQENVDARPIFEVISQRLDFISSTI